MKISDFAMKMGGSTIKMDLYATIPVSILSCQKKSNFENFHKDSGQSRLRGLAILFFNPVSISDDSLFTVKTMSDDGYGGGGDDFDYESGAAGYATSLSTFH